MTTVAFELVPSLPLSLSPSRFCGSFLLQSSPTPCLYVRSSATRRDIMNEMAVPYASDTDGLQMLCSGLHYLPLPPRRTEEAQPVALLVRRPRRCRSVEEHLVPAVATRVWWHWRWRPAARDDGWRARWWSPRRWPPHRRIGRGHAHDVVRVWSARRVRRWWSLVVVEPLGWWLHLRVSPLVRLVALWILLALPPSGFQVWQLNQRQIHGEVGRGSPLWLLAQRSRDVSTGSVPQGCFVRSCPGTEVQHGLLWPFATYELSSRLMTRGGLGTGGRGCGSSSSTTYWWRSSSPSRWRNLQQVSAVLALFALLPRHRATDRLTSSATCRARCAAAAFLDRMIMNSTLGSCSRPIARCACNATSVVVPTMTSFGSSCGGACQRACSRLPPPRVSRLHHIPARSPLVGEAAGATCAGARRPPLACLAPRPASARAQEARGAPRPNSTRRTG